MEVSLAFVNSFNLWNSKIRFWMQIITNIVSGKSLKIVWEMLVNFIWDKKIKMDQIKFVDDSLQRIWPQFFKGCLPQILLGPFLNILSHTTLYGVPLYCNDKQGKLYLFKVFLKIWCRTIVYCTKDPFV